MWAAMLVVAVLLGLVALIATRLRAVRPPPRDPDAPEPVMEAFPARTSTAIPPDGRLGRYLLVAPHEEGGMSVVWRAEDDKRQPCAIKIPFIDVVKDAELRQRFEREVEVGLSLSHPNLINVRDRGSFHHGGLQIPYMVMEFIEGQTLDSWIDAHKADPPDITQALQLSSELAAALQVVHDAGLVHRDIKPGNVMIRPNQSIVLMDFGIARRDKSTLTAKGYALGTPEFIAPEQSTRPGSVDARADLYSIGVMLFMLLTWRLPFESSDPFMLLQKKCTSQPPSPRTLNPEVSEAVEAVTVKLLALRPHDRYGSAKEALTALQAVS
ncbi:MAG: serine/threonine-protein kinase [Candidatus Xenobia bacterium]